MKNLILMLVVLISTGEAFAQCEDLEITTSVYHPTCHDFCDGDFFATISGGTEPYNVSIYDEDWNLLLFKSHSLCAGKYYILVEDSNDCVLLDSVELINPDIIEAEMTIDESSDCEECNGVVSIDTVLNYNGDYSSLTYYFSPSIESDPFDTYHEELCPGDYAVIINDEEGCSQLFNISVRCEGEFLGFEKDAQRFQLSKSDDHIALEINQEGILEMYNLGGQRFQTVELNPGLNEFVPAQKGLVIYRLRTAEGTVKGGKFSW